MQIILSSQSQPYIPQLMTVSFLLGRWATCCLSLGPGSAHHVLQLHVSDRPLRRPEHLAGIVRTKGQVVLSLSLQLSWLGNTPDERLQDVPRSSMFAALARSSALG